jgi:hypothetical protein
MELVSSYCVDNLVSYPMDRVAESQEDERRNMIYLQMWRDLAKI